MINVIVILGMSLVTTALFAVDLAHARYREMPRRRRRTDSPARLFEAKPADDLFRRRLMAVPV